MPALITWWTQDVTALAASATADGGHLVQAVGADLLRRWGEPQRHYHRTQHLVEVFWALEELQDAGEIGERESTLARVAGWYHDAAYDPAASPGANEAESAELARICLPLLHVGPDDVDLVVRLVELTTRHEPRGAGNVAGGAADVAGGAGNVAGGVAAAFSDADLWILAAEQERFDEYCRQVREEYAQVPDPAYRSGRRTILQPLLDRPAVYATAHARLRWEGRARDNLARELVRLG